MSVRTLGGWPPTQCLRGGQALLTERDAPSDAPVYAQTSKFTFPTS
jgi:hypothetical protein